MSAWSNKVTAPNRLPAVSAEAVGFLFTDCNIQDRRQAVGEFCRSAGALSFLRFFAAKDSGGSIGGEMD